MNRTAKFLGSFPYGGVLETGGGILSSPVLAFRFAHVWERAKMEGIDPFDEMGRRRFARSLLFVTRIAGIQDPLALSEDESSLKALDSYLETVSLLLKQWCACDQDPVKWWKGKNNVEQVRMLQKAVASTSFVLQCMKGSRDIQPKPLWASMMGESIPPPRGMAGESILSGKKHEREKYESFYGPISDGDINAPLRLVKSRPFLVAEHSLIEAARKMAYLLFSEVLVQGLKVRFCSRGRCGAAFLPGKKQKYCSEQCGHIASGLQSKNKTQVKRNRDRVRESSKALTDWISKRSRRGWRLSVENALGKEGLIFSATSRSQWLGRCIRAAGSEDNSPQRARLAELCTGPGASEKEIEQVFKDLITLYALIRQAQNRERLFKAKRATAPAATAARRPKAGLG